MLDYEVTSFSEGRKSAQITVTIGEGSEKRSFTRHLRRQGGSLMGLNIDPRAVPLNAKYELELAEAKSELTNAEAALANLKKRLEVVGDVDPSKVDEISIDAARAMLQGMIETAQDDVFQATVDLDDAEAKLNIVRRELPLMMEFHR